MLIQHHKHNIIIQRIISYELLYRTARNSKYKNTIHIIILYFNFYSINVKL